MSTEGFSSVNYRWYNYGATVTALKDDCPVFICSIPDKSKFKDEIKSSHAWLIDGYKSQTRSINIKHILYGKLIKMETFNETLNMLHCDFGWKRGYANGYFAEGIFSFNTQYYEPDNTYNTKPDYNYKHYLRIITYAKPDN